MLHPCRALQGMKVNAAFAAYLAMALTSASFEKKLQSDAAESAQRLHSTHVDHFYYFRCVTIVYVILS